MGKSAIERRIEELLAEHGEFIRHARHGPIYSLPGGQTLQVQATASRRVLDWRAMRNCLADLKRKLREAGIQVDDSDVDEQPGPEPEEEEVGKLSERLKALGIHRQKRVKKVVIVEETREVTMTVNQLAGLVGIDMNCFVEDPIALKIGDHTFYGGDCLTLQATSSHEEEVPEEIVQLKDQETQLQENAEEAA